jgi:hypothetical protein
MSTELLDEKRRVAQRLGNLDRREGGFHLAAEMLGGPELHGPERPGERAELEEQLRQINIAMGLNRRANIEVKVHALSQMAVTVEDPIANLCAALVEQHRLGRRNWETAIDHVDRDVYLAASNQYAADAPLRGKLIGTMGGFRESVMVRVAELLVLEEASNAKSAA